MLIAIQKRCLIGLAEVLMSFIVLTLVVSAGLGTRSVLLLLLLTAAAGAEKKRLKRCAE